MNLTAADIRQQILDRQFAAISCELDRVQLEEIIQKLFVFFALPDEVKNRFAFKLKPNEEERGHEIGYWTRSRANGNQDNRGYFHYNDLADERFRIEGADCPELLAFMDAVKPLYRTAEEKMKEVVRALDAEHTGLYDLFFPADQYPLLFLRLLAYERMEPGDFLASGHYDRGSCTLAMAESAPGLRIGKTPEDVKEVIRDPNTILFFPGLVLQEYTGPEFAPSWHDVIQKEAHLLNQQTARWAIVAFLGSWNQRNLPWQETHAPTY